MPNNFSSVSGKNPDVRIFHSYGKTEAKLVPDERYRNNVILELTDTGKTAIENNLRILEAFGEPVFTRIYSRKGLTGGKELAKNELVMLLENAVEAHPYDPVTRDGYKK